MTMASVRRSLHVTDTQWATPAAVPVFLLECYWPDVTLRHAATAVARARSAAASMTRDGRPVRYLHGVFVPGEESLLCVFEASSAGDVAETARRAALRADRIVAAIDLRAGRATPA
jgi:hypothetical protein